MVGFLDEIVTPDHDLYHSRTTRPQLRASLTSGMTHLLVLLVRRRSLAHLLLVLLSLWRLFPRALGGSLLGMSEKVLLTLHRLEAR
jgi:hypothetical protein